MYVSIASRSLITVFLAGFFGLGMTGFAAAGQDISKYFRGTWQDQSGKTYRIDPDDRSTIESAKLVWPLPLERGSRSVAYRYRRNKLFKFYFVHEIDRPDKIDARIPLAIRRDTIKQKPEYRWILKIEKWDEERLFIELEMPHITYIKADPPVFRGFKYTVSKKSKKVLTPVPTCGPDVTDNLLRVVDHMVRRFRRWSPMKREANCAKLFDIGSLKDRSQQLLEWTGRKNTQGVTRPPFENSWDIKQFAPSKRKKTDGSLTVSGYKYDAPACAKPRWPCGLTVRFLNQCVHFQVLNYIQWGAMNELCSTQIKGTVAHQMRGICKGTLEDLQNDPIVKHLAKTNDGLLDFLANFFKGVCKDKASEILDKIEKPTDVLKMMVFGPDDPDPAWPKLLERQLVFSNLGQDLVAQSKPMRNPDGSLKSYAAFRGLAQRLFDTHIAGASSWASREETKCRLQCTMTSTEKSKLEKLPFNYQFGRYKSSRRSVDE